VATRQSYAAHALPARLEFAELAQGDDHEAGSLELTSRQVSHHAHRDSGGLLTWSGFGSLPHSIIQETQMGMLDGLLGGIVGAGMVSVVNNIIEKHGGLQGVVNEFEKNGLGATVKSWVGTGPNQAISPEEVHRTLGPDLLRQLSQKSGLSVQDLAQKLAQVLPQAVDTMTPDGTIPKA
jgi:uncharacterized protein YidB (DUF937 family)